MANALDRLRDATPLEWQPLAVGDLPALADLLAAIEHVDDTIERHGIEDLQRQFDIDGPDVSSRAVVGREKSGSIVAYGWDHMDEGRTVPNRQVTLSGGVHPAWRDKSIGHAILEWQIDTAKDWYETTLRPYYGPLRLVATADANLTGLRSLLDKHGLVAHTWYCDVHKVFDPAHPPKPAHEPDGISLRPYSTVNPEQVRAAHNEAFARKGQRAVGPGEWDLSMRRPGCRPDLSWVALAGCRVVGYALNSTPEIVDGTGEGWTDRFGVVPAWRGKGVATALLGASAHSFFTAGLGGAGIGFDTEQPEQRLAWYARMGYDIVDSVVAHELVLT